MPYPTLPRPVQLLLFALVLLASYSAREGSAITQAIIWLPSGVAVVGLWFLGGRAAWVVATVTIIHRLCLGYDQSVIWPAALGSTAEALVGAGLLRRLGVRGDFARLRDVLFLGGVACIAPVASILCSWIGRSMPGLFREMPFHSGWDGWWRMNALGILTVVPFASSWRSAPFHGVRVRAVLEALAIGLAMLAILGGVMFLVPPGPTAIMLLYSALPVTLVAGVRFGLRGASSAATLGALFVAMTAADGQGSFLAIPPGERHVPIQLFELTLVGVPLVIGSLIAEREAGVTRLLHSEGLRRAMLTVMPDATCRVDRNGVVSEVFVPDGVQPPLPQSMTGRHLTAVIPAAAARRLLGGLSADGAAGREPVEYPVGEQMFEARAVPLADGEALAVVRDITERKRAERMLAWQAGILELIAAGRPDRDVLAALVQGMEDFHRATRCSILQLQGRQLYQACAPSLPAEYCAGIEGLEIGPQVGCCGRAAHTNQTVVVSDIATDPLWAPFRDLALRHGLRACWSVPVRSPAGEVLGTLASYALEPRAPSPAELATTERAAVLAGISMDRERREHLLASISRNVTQGLFRSVPGRGLVYVNHALARMFGYDAPEELLAAVGAVDGHPEHRGDLARLAAGGGGSAEVESAVHRRDGTRFWALVSSTAVRGADGRVVLHDGAVTDVTARRGLEEQLRQAQKMEAVGQLAGGVAHDFNNLLTAIAGYAETIRNAVSDQPQLRGQIDEVIHATDRAARLTRQLLAFSRQQVLTPEVLDLNATVDHLGGMLRRLIGEHIELVTQHDDQPAFVLVDRGQIEQVIVNLAVNARDAMLAGGSLTITTAAVEVAAASPAVRRGVAPGPWVVLSVADTGVGMDQDVLARAFDPFFTTKAPGKGTGLGLATVYGIVKQSGGVVWIDSAPGMGATGWVYLPQAPRPEPVAATSMEPATAPAHATVLLVEDEKLVRDLLRLALERAGYRVLVAEDGQAALELAAGHTGAIDLLLTDVVMPRMGGRELAGRLKAQRLGLRVLFMSGYASDGHGHAEDLSGEELLPKPFAPSLLLRRLAQILGGGVVVPPA